MMNGSSNLAIAEEAVERQRVYLHPGQSLIATVPTVVTTILGSCVSVCLWDETRALGGLTHYLLPQPVGAQLDSARFGATAIPQLAQQLQSRGATRLTAKIFGGAAMNSALSASGRDLGTKNAAIAAELLDRLGIPVAAVDTGGSSGRKLLFHTDDGTALVKYLGARS